MFQYTSRTSFSEDRDYLSKTVLHEANVSKEQQQIK